MSSSNPITSLSLVGFGISLFVLYGLGLAIYRLYFSPVAKFPGPKLAALTLWYEFYYDVVKRGQYTFEIGKMHEKYGPIVRINPYELHVSDPEFYDVLYTGSGTRRDKWEWSAKMFGNSTSMLGTVHHDHHRMRRGALNPYFSKRSVMALEPMIRSVVEKLCSRFEEFKKSQEPVNLGDAYAALTMDVITEYSFSKSYECVDQPNFAPEWVETIERVSEGTHMNKQFGWLIPIMKKMPMSFVKKINPNMMRLIGFKQDLAKQIIPIMQKKSDAKYDHPTIFHELLNSDMPDNEKTLPRLVDEGQTIVGAGQVTTAHYLKMTSYRILSNPKVLAKLKAELDTIMPNADVLAPLTKLEQLPYLSAVVTEGFRTSYGVVSRLARVSPNEPLKFHDWTIPPGTPIGMTSIFIHDDPKLFPDPEQFNPERWLNQGSRNRLERYLVNFSKGTRICLGLNLAHAEIYLALAAVFRRFDLELFDTTYERDVKIVHDFFNPATSRDSKGIRALIK